jgi:hypothetical protein
MNRGNCGVALDAYQSAVKLFTELRDEHKLDPAGEGDLEDLRQRMAECARR